MKNVLIFVLLFSMMIGMISCETPKDPQDTSIDAPIEDPVEKREIIDTSLYFFSKRYFKNNVKMLSTTGTIEPSDDIINTREILLFGGSVKKVNLYQSEATAENGIMYSYKTDDKKVYCHFSNTDKLKKLSFETECILRPEQLSSLDDYLNWITGILSIYGYNDMSKYKLSVESCIEDNLGSQRDYDFLYLDVQENETLKYYKFDFKSYIFGIPSSDSIEVLYVPRYSNAGYERAESLSIVFDENNFAGYNNDQFDSGKIDSLAKSFISDNINTDKYTLTSVDVIEKKFTVLDGRRCCLCTMNYAVTSSDPYEYVSPENHMYVALFLE